MSTVVASVIACAGPPDAAPPPNAAPRPTSPSPAPAAVEPPPAPAPVELDRATQARVAQLTARFGGGQVCDAEALAALRTLEGRHGDPPALRDALLAALTACEDPEGVAGLLARTMPPDADPEHRLALGAAWIRAARYDEAVDVLVPLAETEGASSKAAWLAAFALFHAGDSERALPWLLSARAHASAPDGSDGPLLVGLAKLHTGDVDGAIAELEQGRATAPHNVSVLSALARAYATAGRDDDADRTSAQARQAAEESLAQERAALRLSALGTQLRQAHERGDVEAVETTFDEMWPGAPTPARIQMLKLRAQAYEQAGRADDAAADRAQAVTLAKEATP